MRQRRSVDGQFAVLCGTQLDRRCEDPIDVRLIHARWKQWLGQWSDPIFRSAPRGADILSLRYALDRARSGDGPIASSATMLHCSIRCDLSQVPMSRFPQTPFNPPLHSGAQLPFAWSVGGCDVEWYDYSSGNAASDQSGGEICVVPRVDVYPERIASMAVVGTETVRRPCNQSTAATGRCPPV